MKIPEYNIPDYKNDSQEVIEAKLKAIEKQKEKETQEDQKKEEE